MNILKKVEKSTLWILAYNESARQNLKLEAKKRGIDPKRIVFAEQISIVEDHLQRIKLADIFLDTFPYNAHTTASDSIRMGLPLITMKGNSFASRVAASILSSINMSELITDNIDDYENLAIELGNNKFKLNEIKENMIRNVQKSNFFNSEIFTKELESIYKDLIKKN
jgi:predicted O-linked N-acetylglucosamine transferase (SPINDLY family)